MIPRSSRFPLLALAAVLLVSAAWWALALWPIPASAPGWLERTREICFGRSATGLPTPAGWLALILEPVGLIVALAVVWGAELRAGLAGLSSRRVGQALLGTAGFLLVGGLTSAAGRIRSALMPDSATTPVASRALRLSDRAPPLALIDQRGEPFTLARLGGRRALVTFAYGHCETVCPTLLAELRRARGSSTVPVLVVVTLDPWRDTPARLPAIAAAWGLANGDYLLGGGVSEVEAVLAEWDVSWERDSRSGEIVHTVPVFVLTGDGLRAWQVGGGQAGLAVRLGREGG